MIGKGHLKKYFKNYRQLFLQPFCITTCPDRKACMKKIFLFVFIFQFNNHCYAQQKYSSHASQFQLELFGPGSLFSLNYDTRFLKRENGIGFRIGIGGSPLGFFGKSCNSGAQMSLPLGVNYLFGNNNHYAEIGGGIVTNIIAGTKAYCPDLKPTFFGDATETYEYLLAGYRYQPRKKKGITYRAFISPLFQSGFDVKLCGGISVGYKL